MSRLYILAFTATNGCSQVLPGSASQEFPSGDIALMLADIDTAAPRLTAGTRSSPRSG